MQLQVVTPHGAKVDTTVSQVTVPGVLGEMGILAGHLPLISGLGVRVLRYTGDSGVERLAVSGGFVEVADDVVIVVSETAERPSEIDVVRAELSLEKAQAAMQAAEAGSEDWHIAAAKVARAENRLVAEKLD